MEEERGVGRGENDGGRMRGDTTLRESICGDGESKRAGEEREM